MKHAREWLQDGDKVKATIWFRGREMTHRELGSKILAKLEQDLLDVSEVEARPRMEGNQMFIIFGPKKHKGGGPRAERPAQNKNAGSAAPVKAPVATPALENPPAKDPAGSSQSEPPVPAPQDTPQ